MVNPWVLAIGLFAVIAVSGVLAWLAHEYNSRAAALAWFVTAVAISIATAWFGIVRP